MWAACKEDLKVYYRTFYENGRFIGSQKGVLRGRHFSKDFLPKRKLAIYIFILNSYPLTRR
jgi:hypothetical protein